MALVAFTLNAKFIGPFVNSIAAYFICESSGSGTSGKCDNEMKAYESQNNYSIVNYLSFVLVAFLPAVSLIYVVQCGELQRCIRSRKMGKKSCQIDLDRSRN